MQPCSPFALLIWLQVGQYHVPKDTVVHINLWGMQHDEQYWQDAEAFRPERWLGDKTGGDKSGGMAYLPFGLGPRMCVGIKLACKLPCIHCTLHSSSPLLPLCMVIKGCRSAVWCSSVLQSLFLPEGLKCRL